MSYIAPVSIPAYGPTPVPLPGSFEWDTTNFNFTPMVYNNPGATRSSGYVVTPAGVLVTPEALFNLFSTALSAPGATYWVDVVAGSDANAGTSQGSPVKSINKAIQLANAGAVPATINIKGAGSTNPFATGNGVYPRANSAPGSSGIAPTVDIALVAYNGLVVTGSFDLYSAPSLDGAFTNCYSYATSNTDRIIDLLNTDRDGNFIEFQNVSTATICNNKITNTGQGGGCWSAPAGTLYIQRADGAAVTNANTMVLRSASYGGFYNPNQVNVYMGDGGGALGFPASGFDVYGACATLSVGGITWYIASPNNSKTNVLVCKNVRSRFAGGILNTNGRAFGVDSFKGLAAFFNCSGDCAATDAFNLHNNNSASSAAVLTVNCSGRNNGRNNASNNFLTHHDSNTFFMDVCGYGARNRGGSVRSVGNAKGLFAGTYIENDLGDLMMQSASGNIPQTAFTASGNTTYWCAYTKTNMPAGIAMDYMTEGAGASLFTRGAWPHGALAGGPGTNGTW